VKEIIAGLDREVPQVLIKVLIAEVTHEKSMDLGPEFSVLNLRAITRGTEVFTDPGVADVTGGLVFKLIGEHASVAAALAWLDRIGKLDVLSRPYILGSDNQPAMITVGQEVPLVTSSRTTETGQTINNFTYRDIGIILNVTPHINPDGLVILDVSPEISALASTTVPISETLSMPIIAKRSASSRVAIRDGQTIVIGGLMEDRKTETVKKVPLLGYIPILGALFRRTTTDTTKTELLIFLTPHVALEAASLEGISEGELQNNKLVPQAIEPGALEKQLQGMQRNAPPPADIGE
jgi:general secretion pathway protein D